MATAKKDATKEVAAAADQLPSTDVYDYSGEQGGYEGTDSTDILIPFLTLLQPMSPQVNEDGTDARPGMMWNSVQEAAIPSGELCIVPSNIGMREYVEWRPRDHGGGLVARHQPQDAIVEAAKNMAEEQGLPYGTLLVPSEEKDKDGKPILNELVETVYCYGAVIDEADDWQPTGEFLCIAFTSTKIKGFKQFLTRQRSVKGNPPPWAHRVRVQTKKEPHDKHTFYVFEMKPAVENNVLKSLLPTDHPAFQAGKELYALINDGVAKADFNTSDGSGKEGAGRADQSGAEMEDDTF